MRCQGDDDAHLAFELSSGFRKMTSPFTGLISDRNVSKADVPKLEDNSDVDGVVHTVFKWQCLPQHQPEVMQANGTPDRKEQEGLPGLSIVTWEEFMETPDILYDLFEVDHHGQIHFNGDKVSVFFCDARVDQPQFGAPSVDGLSW